jgi:heavy metal sensor kinase
LVREVDRFLIDETDELAKVLTQEADGTRNLKNFEIEVASRTYYPIYFRVVDGNGSPLYISDGFKGIGYRLEETVISNVREGRKVKEKIHSPKSRTPYRIISTPVYRDGKFTEIIQVGTHLRFVKKSLSGFKGNILIALPIVLILGSLGGWILARRSLSPIGYIASRTQSISSKSLSERLTPRGTDDEMDDLIRTINEMIARLENSFERMAEFTADASHELKTPICAMRGEAEVLLSKERKAEEYQEALAHFIDRFDHLNRMINDLILLSKSDSSQMESKMEPVRLDLLIEEICSLFQVLAEQKGVGWKADGLQKVTVLGDKVRLQQLFTNLIDNAIKYTPMGSIQITLEKNWDEALVKIKDTGIGIPREEHEKIFKRFYRVDKSRSKETGGVGLGLSIAEWIAHAHLGKIEVESELNKGSTFTVYLPIRNA